MRSVLTPLAFVLVLGSMVARDAAWFEETPWVLVAGLDVDRWEAVPPSATFTDEAVGGLTGCTSS